MFNKPNAYFCENTCMAANTSQIVTFIKISNCKFKLLNVLKFF